MNREEACKELEELGSIVFGDVGTNFNPPENRTEAARRYMKVLGYLKGALKDD